MIDALTIITHSQMNTSQYPNTAFAPPNSHQVSSTAPQNESCLSAIHTHISFELVLQKLRQQIFELFEQLRTIIDTKLGKYAPLT